MGKEKLIHHGRLASIETLIVGMAHEIGNSNSTITLNLALIVEAWQSIIPILERYQEENGDFNVGGINYSEMRECIFAAFDGISDGAKRTQRIVQTLKEFADPRRHGTRGPIDINLLVEKAVALVKGLARRSTRQVEVEYGSAIPRFDGDFQRIQQVVIHLIEHICRKRGGSGPPIRLRTRYDLKTGAVIVEVEIDDPDSSGELAAYGEIVASGIGQPERNEGLELSVAAEIVRQSGGTLTVGIGQDGGTVFAVALPVAGCA